MGKPVGGRTFPLPIPTRPSGGVSIVRNPDGSISIVRNDGIGGPGHPTHPRG
ncbi:hypothetical protein [Amycolatopsis jiangsuensis]|uniref:Uncharacterized protein n=1 Tax=Amycolatopsis jiangsuensis TaxID=1181879 RepID=A0A840J0E9_9PSEU|nr:hypothetical protein [Amycolatopsis jiangsuensis]MBB4687209.1 hypothetical protein [Amycolatopsis jiangsuensis]